MPIITVLFVYHLSFHLNFHLSLLKKKIHGDLHMSITTVSLVYQLSFQDEVNPHPYFPGPRSLPLDDQAPPDAMQLAFGLTTPSEIVPFRSE